MSYYETVYIARQDLSPVQVEELTQSFVKLIKDGGGTVHKTESWGLRTLAHRIRKNRKGHYVLIETDAPAAALIEMERNMRLNEDVLRYMTVRIEELPEGPSAILKQSDEDDRGGFGGDREFKPREDRGDYKPRGEYKPREDRKEGAE